jgi:hypothetical protein
VPDLEQALRHRAAHPAKTWNADPRHLHLPSIALICA